MCVYETERVRVCEGESVRERVCVRERVRFDRLGGGLVGSGGEAVEFVVGELEAHLEGAVQPQVVRLDVLLHQSLSLNTCL